MTRLQGLRLCKSGIASPVWSMPGAQHILHRHSWQEQVPTKSVLLCDINGMTRPQGISRICLFLPLKCISCQASDLIAFDGFQESMGELVISSSFESRDEEGGKAAHGGQRIAEVTGNIWQL